jgi:predicted TIM-barrel fold metal-dependent hydrolase
MNTVDSHAHLPPGEDAAERLLALMDRCSIARAVVVPGGTVTPEVLSRQMSLGGGVDVTPDNPRVRAAAWQSGGRLLPFYFANPHGSTEEYRYEGATYCGLKLGPAVHGVPFDDPRVIEFVELAAAHRHPVYVHCLARPGFTVADVVALAKRFTGIPVILGHAAGGHCEFQALDIVAPVPNVSLEMSGGFTSFVQAAVLRLGVRRVLFGSEYPLQDPRAELAKMRCLDVPESDLEMMLGRNIERLLASGAA